MYPRVNYEMTEEDKRALLEACKSVPYLVVGGCAPSSPQENANRAWQRLGEKMGFNYMTVKPIQGKGVRFFSAVPSETAAQKESRLALEAEEGRQADIRKLQREIAERQTKLDAMLKAQSNQAVV
jgi:hypothetical protein